MEGRRYNSSTSFTQLFTFSSINFGSIAACCIKSVLSIVAICVKLTADVFSKPEIDFSSNKLPGREANSVFDVMAAHITVFMLLRLKLSPCMINTGRRFVGADPSGGGRFAHHISPRTIYQSSLFNNRYAASFRPSSSRDSWVE